MRIVCFHFKQFHMFLVCFCTIAHVDATHVDTIVSFPFPVLRKGGGNGAGVTNQISNQRVYPRIHLSMGS